MTDKQRGIFLLKISPALLACSGISAFIVDLVALSGLGFFFAMSAAFLFIGGALSFTMGIIAYMGFMDG